MRYWGFISYSRADEDEAKWLHRAVERYVVPRKLVGRPVDDTTAPRRLFPLFRDSDELPASSSIGDALNDALAQSRNLIVLCSPHSATSEWVNEEILRFKRLGRGDRVFCVLLRGEPNTAFPKALQGERSVGSRESTGVSSDVPLAADLRPGGDGKHLTLLKVVAGLLRLRLDELIARDQRRRRWRIAQASAASLLVLLIGGGVWLNENRKVQSQRRIAATQALIARAQGLMNDPARLPTAALLGVKAWRDAFELGQPAQQALDVMRQSASLLASPTRLRLQSSTGVNHGVASADGHWLATPDNDAVLLWDARDGSLAATIRAGAHVDALAFTPDATLVVVAGEDVETWSLAPATRVSSLHIAGLSAPALSIGGSWLAGEMDSPLDIGVWDLKNGGRQTLKVRADVWVKSLAISPDGKRLGAGVAESSNSGVVDPGWRLWDVTTGALLARGKAATYPGAVAFSPGGRTLAISAGNIELIDAATGRNVGAVRGSSDELVWSPNERWLAGSSNPVQVWDAILGDEVARLPADGVVVSFTSDGLRLFTGDGRSWAMNSRARLERSLSAPGSSPVNSIAFAGTAYLATAQQAGDVVVWQIDEASRGPTLQESLSARVIAVSNDGRLALTMSGNTLGAMWSARLWDARNGAKIAELSPGGHIDYASFGADGSELAVSDDEGALTRYSTKDGSVIARTKPPARGDDPRTYVLSALPGSNRWLASAVGGALVWGAGYEKPEFLNIGENPVVATFANEKTLWQAGPGLLVERDAQTLREKRRVPVLGRQLGRLAVSHDSNLVAVAIDSAIRVIDGTNGRALFDLPLPEIAVKNPEGESVHVSEIVLSPDGHWLAVVLTKRGRQQQPVSDISLWSLDKRARVAVLERDAEDVTFSSDGLRFAIITQSGLVRVSEWIPTRLIADLCARVGRDLTAPERSAYLAMSDSRPVCGQ
jgi:WD40 repeat protein